MPIAQLLSVYVACSSPFTLSSSWSSFEQTAGMNMSPVSRLKKTWSKVKTAKFDILEVNVPDGPKSGRQIAGRWGRKTLLGVHETCCPCANTPS